LGTRKVIMAQNPWEEEYEEEGPWNEEYEEASPDPVAEATPYPYKPQLTPVRSIGMVDLHPEKTEAAQRGIAVDQKAPEAVRTGRASFATSPEQWNDFLQAEFFRELGPSAEIRDDPGLGEKVFWNPATKRWTPVGQSSITERAYDAFGKIAAILGAAIPAALTRNPTLAGTMVRGAGNTAAGAAGTNYALQQMGNQMGVNDLVDFDNPDAPKQQTPAAEQLATAAKTGAIEGAMELGGSTAALLVKYGRNRLMGNVRAFDDETAQALLDGVQKYEQNIANINQYSDTKWIPYAHQFLDPEDPAAMIAEKRLALAEAEGDEALQRKILQQRMDANGAIRSYFHNWGAGFDMGIPATADGRHQAGEVLQQGLQGTVEKGNRDAQAAAVAAQQASREAVSGLPQGIKAHADTAGSYVRDQLWAQSAAAGSQVDEAYKLFDNQISFNAKTNSTPHKVPVDDPNLQAIIEKYNVNTLTGEWKGAKPKVVAGKKTRYYDLATIDAARRRLREIKDVKTTGGTDITTSTLDLVRGHKDLDNLMTDYLKRASLSGELPAETYDTYMAAKRAAHDEARLFKQGLIGEILHKDEAGNYSLRNVDVVNKIVARKDWRAAEQLFDAVKDDPAVMAEMNKYILAMYEKMATKDGMTSRALHDKFMSPNGYGPLVDMFVTSNPSWRGEASKRISTFGELSDMATATIEKAKVLDKALRASLGGRLTRWSPEEITQGILSRRLKNEDIFTVTKLARKYKALEPLQNGLMNEIALKTFPQGLDQAPNLFALKKLLDENGVKIASVMGNEYASALYRLADARDVLMRNPAKMNDPPLQTPLQAALRVQTGVMSKEGLFLTFLNKWGRNKLPSAIYEALTDKEKLQTLANWTRTQKIVARTAGAAAAGSSAYVGEENRRD